MLRSFWILALAAFLLGGAPSAHAYLVFFGEDLNDSEDDPLAAFPNASAAEADFLALLDGAGTEDFEGFAEGDAEPLNLMFGGVLATLSGGDGMIASVDAGETNTVGRYGTSPTNYWDVEAGDDGDFLITFSEPVAAFGFFGVDIGDFGGDLELLLGLEGGGDELFDVENTQGAGGSTGGSVLFYGVVAEEDDELISTVAFLTASGDGDAFGFDDFTVGTREQTMPPAPNPVPEPGTAFLVGLGLVGLGARRRRV